MAPISQSLTSRRIKELHGPVAPGQPQSVPVPGSQRPGHSAVYRHWQFPDGPLETLDPAIRTLHDAFEATAALAPKNRYLGHRTYDPAKKQYGEYVWQDYATVQRRRANLGAGLVQLHRDLGLWGDKYGVGLWTANRPEWQITDLACMSQGLYTVSLYDTLGPDAVEYIITHSGLTTVVASVTHVAALLKLKPRLPTLKAIVCIDPIEGNDKPGESKKDIFNALAKGSGVQIFGYEEVEKIGEARPLPLNPPVAQDVTTINYTSGTTGNPKGVILTHRNAVAATYGSMINGGTTSADTLLSLLPLAHIYERLTEHTLMFVGGSIGYFHGDVAAVVEDAKVLRPTIFVAVPRLWNRFGAAIRAATQDAPGVKGALSRHIIGVKLANINNPDPAVATNKHSIYDRIWAKKVQQAFGLDRTRYMISGASPLDGGLHKLLRVIFANNFAEGYGMTESYAAALLGSNGDMTTGNCGPVVPPAELCLRDVPDMEYLSTDKPNPRGELLIRGPTVFREYYKLPEETAKALDADGWLHTGDIAEVDGMGRWKIIDRVKNLLKLAQGEYISPERIENALLASCGWLAAAYVHGDGTQASLVGLFGVAPDQFAPFASGVLGTTVAATDLEAVAEAAKHPKVRAAALERLQEVARAEKMNSWERVRAVWLGLDPFTDQDGLITPTFKLKRPKVAKHYRAVIDEMYATVNAQETGRPKL